MKQSTASGLKKLFFVIITMLSMATSFLFFVDVFSIGNGLIEDNIISVLLNGTIGVLVLDVAAIVWLRVYLQASDNNDLRAIAIVGAIIGMVGSAITSLAYLLMSASNTVVQPEIQIYAQWAIAVIIVIHFVLVFLSQYRATSAKIDEKTADMLAEATDEMLVLTEQSFRDNIPALAKQQAGELTRLLAGRFANLSAMQRIRDESTGYNTPTPRQHGDVLINGQPQTAMRDDNFIGFGMPENLTASEVADFLAENPQILAQLNQQRRR